MKTNGFAWFLMCGILVSGCVQSQPTTSLETSALYQNCMLCHSTQESQRGPILDGQNSVYLFDQLKKFKNGQRGANPEHRQEALMGVASQNIDERDLKRISRHIAALPPKPYTPSIKGDIAKGHAIYTSNCLPCHGKQAEGRRIMKTGSLAVLEDWYVLTQLRHFKNGRRGVHAEDTQGQTMAASVADMNDQDLRDVVAYIADAFGYTLP